MKSTEETRAKAQGVLDYIHAHPEKHDQKHWIENPNSFDGCGTTMCVAGTANWLEHGLDARDYDSEVEAARLFGLNFAESQVVFYEMDEDRAVQKLKKIVVGEDLTKEDYWTSPEENGDLMFRETYWALRDRDISADEYYDSFD